MRVYFLIGILLLCHSLAITATSDDSVEIESKKKINIETATKTSSEIINKNATLNDDEIVKITNGSSLELDESSSRKSYYPPPSYPSPSYPSHSPPSFYVIPCSAVFSCPKECPGECGKYKSAGYGGYACKCKNTIKSKYFLFILSFFI
jgi:hypothetical protein